MSKEPRLFFLGRGEEIVTIFWQDRTMLRYTGRTYLDAQEFAATLWVRVEECPGSPLEQLQKPHLLAAWGTDSCARLFPDERPTELRHPALVEVGKGGES